MAMSGQQDPYIKEPMEPLTAQERLTARQMFTSGTPCLKCHVTGDPTHDAKAIAPNFLLASERLKPDWTFRWLLDPSQISPGTAMPTGLFRKEGDRWVVNLPNPPASANAYQHDHARLLVRYMFEMSPEEQRALLATAPVAPTAPASSAEHHARAKRKRVSHHSSTRRGGLGRILGTQASSSARVKLNPDGNEEPPLIPTMVLSKRAGEDACAPSMSVLRSRRFRAKVNLKGILIWRS